eukprot:NODE_166_length_14584_cov_1.124750.p5 type:complete len:394 gc:universal NODE_166_length_14584_cov_1.124750:8911-7730(-)
MRIHITLVPKSAANFSIAHKNVYADEAEFEITHHTILFEKLKINDECIDLSNITEQSEYELKNGNKLIIVWHKTDKQEGWKSQISDLFKQYSHGWNVGYLSSFKALSILKDYQYHCAKDYNEYPIVKVEELKHVFHFFNIVLCSYGWKGLNTFGYGNTYLVDFIRPKSNEKIIREHLQIPKAHVLMYSEKVKAFKPAYFVIYDQIKECIVIVVRGTMSFHDAVTDFVCNYHPWDGGFVHEGMYKSAVIIFEEIKHHIKEWALQFNTKSITFLGHSMGGAVATILSKLCIDEIEGYQFNAITYGAPPVVTASLLPSLTHVISVVNHHDFASRMSYSAMVRLRENISTIDNYKDEYSQEQLFSELNKPIENKFPQVLFANLDASCWSCLLDAQTF